ncbi:helix-turn-helix transcriptional regulator [Paracoccus sp. M683]|uniref:ArsR/SmtB family transcription factor n=1 Tax=Paracoccus sp. M683 TaxID=2594268 RepID=UPI00117DF121|nr:helix-turn-helix transcriptional regulator [Paracoccus sp. M683]TRW98435.1 helix-turn-helix transcriptional regulator [Paracoccus sp. M683]
MKDGPDIARIAALIGEPARANMLTALMTGKALTATELAAEAGVTLPTASAHLAKLDAGGLLTIRKQGRHRYAALAGPEVASVLEALMGLAAGAGHLRSRTGPRDAALRKARVCYNHLAGDLGTQLFDALIAGDLIRPGDPPRMTAAGEGKVRDFGIDLDALSRERAALCRECLDWSERRSHLAGSLGRALLARIEALGWAKRQPGSRVILFSRQGEAAFRASFNLPEG